MAPGTSIGIIVSSGPPPTPDEVDVPNVVGLALAEAQQVIERRRLEAMPVPATGSGKPANEVVAQTPEGGTKAQKDRQRRALLFEWPVADGGHAGCR